MTVSVSETSVQMTVNVMQQNVDMHVGVEYANAPAFDGDYEVTPRLHNPIVLETAEKLMQDDVTIHEIPITRTTNPQNGITVLIG